MKLLFLCFLIAQSVSIIGAVTQLDYVEWNFLGTEQCPMVCNTKKGRYGFISEYIQLAFDSGGEDFMDVAIHTKVPFEVEYRKKKDYPDLAISYQRNIDKRYLYSKRPLYEFSVCFLGRKESKWRYKEGNLAVDKIAVHKRDWLYLFNEINDYKIRSKGNMKIIQNKDGMKLAAKEVLQGGIFSILSFIGEYKFLMEKDSNKEKLSNLGCLKEKVQVWLSIKKEKKRAQEVVELFENFHDSFRKSEVYKELRDFYHFP